ncbi:retrovirus-related Pol poly from transposon TNT 1-94, partial [Olea europaea subsp. europaea]
KLMNLKLKEGKSVAKHLSEFQDLINQLTTMKIVLDDEMQALLLLSSLPNSWETLVVSLSNSAPIGVLELTLVKDGLFNEEIRRKDLGSDYAQSITRCVRPHSRKACDRMAPPNSFFMSKMGPNMRLKTGRNDAQALITENR